MPKRTNLEDERILHDLEWRCGVGLVPDMGYGVFNTSGNPATADQLETFCRQPMTHLYIVQAPSD
jgi:hypothetical protein